MVMPRYSSMSYCHQTLFTGEHSGSGSETSNRITQTPEHVILLTSANHEGGMHPYQSTLLTNANHKRRPHPLGTGEDRNECGPHRKCRLRKQKNILLCDDTLQLDNSRHCAKKLPKTSSNKIFHSTPSSGPQRCVHKDHSQ